MLGFLTRVIYFQNKLKINEEEFIYNKSRNKIVIKKKIKKKLKINE